MRAGFHTGRLTGRRMSLFSRKFGLSPALLAKFILLFDGKYDGDNLANDLGDGIIEVTGKDWSTKYIPETSATFKVSESIATLLGNDGFWVVDGVRQDKTFTQLIESTTLTTFVKYSDFEPYMIQAIGILKAGESITESDEKELTRFFKLWFLYFGDPPRDYGYMKDNRYLPLYENPNLYGTIAGNAVLCQYAPPASVTFGGHGGTTPFTFHYTINDGETLSVTTTGSNSYRNVSTSNGTAGDFVHRLVGISEGSNPDYMKSQNMSVLVRYNPAPTATIEGSATVSQGAAEPAITFTGGNATAPYTFRYRINGGDIIEVTTTSGNSVVIYAPTDVTGEFVYTLVSVKESSITQCSRNQTGTVTITVE